MSNIRVVVEITGKGWTLSVYQGDALVASYEMLLTDTGAKGTTKIADFEEKVDAVSEELMDSLNDTEDAYETAKTIRGL